MQLAPKQNQANKWERRKRRGEGRTEHLGAFGSIWEHVWACVETVQEINDKNRKQKQKEIQKHQNENEKEKNRLRKNGRKRKWMNYGG